MRDLFGVFGWQIGCFIFSNCSWNYGPTEVRLIATVNRLFVFRVI